MNRLLPTRPINHRLRNSAVPALKSTPIATSLLLILSLPLMIFLHACASRANETAPTITTAVAAVPGIPADGHVVTPEK